MQSYAVKGADGNFYGPADIRALNQWASEGRILADTLLIEQGTNRNVLARDLPGLAHHFQLAPRPQQQTPPPARTPYSQGVPYSAPVVPVPSAYGPPKSKVTAFLLALFLGFIGVHRFYLGHGTSGMAMLAICVVGYFLCGLGPIVTMVWAVLDCVMILTGQLKDADGRSLR